MTSAIIPPSMRETARRFAYSPAVACGDWVMISGQVGRDETGHAIADPEAQFVAAFENVGAILTEAGLSFADIVDLSTFHTSFDSFALFADVKNRFITSEPYPAWTGVGVTALAQPGLFVEIKALARREANTDAPL